MEETFIRLLNLLKDKVYLKRQGLILSKANHDFSIVSKGGNFSCLGETFSRVIIFHFKAKTEIRNFTTYFYIIYFQKEDEDIFSDLLSLEKEILSITSKLDNFSLSFASKNGLKVQPTIVNQLLLYLFNRSFEEPSVLYQENDPLQSFINLVEINKMLPKELKKQFSFIINDNGISPINVNIYSSDDVSLRKENIQTKVCLLESLHPIQDDIYDPTVYQKILVYYLKDRNFASLFNDKIDFKKLLSLGTMIQDKYISSYNVLETIINLKVVKDNDYYLLEQVQSYLMTYLTDNEFYDYEVLYYLQTTDNDYSLPNLVNKIVNDDNYELALTLVYFYRSYLSCLLHNDKQLNIDLTIELVKVIKGFLDNNNYINDYFFSFIFGIEPYIISDELLLKEIYLFCLIDSFNFEKQKSSILNQLIAKFKDILKNEYYANDLLEDIQISRDLFDALINNNLIENTSYRLYLKKLQDGLFKTTKLKCSIGVAPTKFLAKMGSDYKKPMGITIIRKKDIKDILFPLPVKDLFGIGKKTYPKIERAGYKTIGDLYYGIKNNDEALSNFFGSYKQDLIDELEGNSSDVVSTGPLDPKSMGMTRTLDFDSNDKFYIRNFLTNLINNILDDFSGSGRLCKTIQITYKNANHDEGFQTTTVSKSFDNYTDSREEIYREGIKLFEKTYKGEEIRLIGFTLKNLKDKHDVVVQMTFDNFERHESENKTQLLINELNRKAKKPIFFRLSDLKDKFKQ